MPDHCRTADAHSIDPMLSTTASAALTEPELDRLHDFLDAGPAAMNLETMDGYFTALISGPVMVSPNEALQQVLGDDLVFESNDEAGEIIKLVMRHWNWVASELHRTLAEEHVYLPVLLEDQQGVTHGNDWARGFMRGVQARPGSWSALLADNSEVGSLLPMMMLVHEHDPDPELKAPPIDDKKREELLIAMVAGATRSYRYYESHRRAGNSSINAPTRRQTSKVGRNEPCPCGSGRKYKHCCAQGAH
jgi:uncharacterized protein